MTKLMVFTTVSFSILFFATSLFADTIYLKNGSHEDGVIEHEDKDGVELNLGFGTTTFHRSEIDHVVKSDAAQTQAIWKEWGQRQKEVEKRKPEEERKWHERQAELERIRQELAQSKKEKEEYGSKDIQVATKDGSILVNVLLNQKIRTTLVLDSGASTVILTPRIAEKLEIDVNQLKKINIQVADGRRVQAGSTTLERVKVQNKDMSDTHSGEKPGIEAKNVEVSFLLEETDTKDHTVDGLLGMSFLKNFKFNADYKNSKVTFERLKDETLPADR